MCATGWYSRQISAKSHWTPYVFTELHVFTWPSTCRKCKFWSTESLSGLKMTFSRTLFVQKVNGDNLLVCTHIQVCKSTYWLHPHWQDCHAGVRWQLNQYLPWQRTGILVSRILLETNKQTTNCSPSLFYLGISKTRNKRFLLNVDSDAASVK